LNGSLRVSLLICNNTIIHTAIYVHFPSGSKRPDAIASMSRDNTDLLSAQLNQEKNWNDP
jgi:hypothetical protein